MHEVAARKVRNARLCGGRIAHWTLDCGRGNVIDSIAIAELVEQAEIAASESELVAIVLDHAGPDFSFGASVEEHAPDRVRSMLPALHRLALRLVELPLPLIACVRGRCLGGGLELALLADRIVAAPNASFAQPELKLGVFAPLGSLLLPRFVGAQRAAELALSGRAVGVAEALRIGLVAELADEPTKTAVAWVEEQLCPKSSSSVRFAVRALRSTWTRDFAANLARLEALYLDELMQTNDACEGIRAFLGKRTPQWTHR